MDLKFLNKVGVKDLRNTLKYLDDPDSIKNASQKTKLSKKENRKNIITNSFKNLTDKDKQLLITYLKSRHNTTKEIIEAFINLKELEERGSIVEFLDDLMKSIDNKSLKLKIFKLIYLNDAHRSLAIVYKTESEDYKRELCELCVLLNPERGYIYGLLNDIHTTRSRPLDAKKMVSEINVIQPLERQLILEKVMQDYDEAEKLVEQINNEIDNRNFQMFYTLALNFELLDHYDINISKENLMLLRWAIHMTESKQDDNFISEVMKKDLNPYPKEWLVFISINLLNMNDKSQRLSMMIFDYIIDSKELTSNDADGIADHISMHIKDEEVNRYHLFETLKKLNTTKDIYNILAFACEKESNLIKDKNFESYISKKIKYTQEFRWIEELENSSDYIEAKSGLKLEALVFALREKSPRSNYNILSQIEENDRNLYIKVMGRFTELIANKLDDDRKYTKLMIALNYQCEDKAVLNEIKEYEIENSTLIRAFIELCNPSLLGERYMEEIKSAVNANDNQRITEILADIKESHTKTECSELVFDSFIETNFDGLIDIWEYLSLGIQRRLKIKEKALEMLTTKQLKLTEKNICFANEIGLDPVILYNSIEDEAREKYLLNIWYQSNEIGKIIDVLKERTTNEARSLDDIKEVQRLLEEYNINDHSLSTLIKIKAYTFISLELLELNRESEKAFHRLKELATQLNFYGLIDRFLMDELLQTELDERLINYLFEEFISSADSDDMWTYYWNNIVNDLNNHRYGSYNGKMEIFLSYLTKSNKKIEWFLETVDNISIDHETYINILENLLMLSNKQNRIIVQSKQELDHMYDKTLTDIGLAIGRTLGNMERTIISRSKNFEDDILVENLKSFRRKLIEVGIEPVEDINNYGKEVKLNSNIHRSTQLDNMDKGVVDSLGIKINNKSILLSTLLNTD